MPLKKKWLFQAMDATLKPYAMTGFRAHSMIRLLLSWFSSGVPADNHVSPNGVKNQLDASHIAMAKHGLAVDRRTRTGCEGIQFFHHMLLVLGVGNIEALFAKQPRYAILYELWVVLEGRNSVD